MLMLEALADPELMHEALRAAGVLGLLTAALSLRSWLGAGRVDAGTIAKQVLSAIPGLLGLLLANRLAATASSLALPVLIFIGGMAITYFLLARITPRVRLPMPPGPPGSPEHETWTILSLLDELERPQHVAPERARVAVKVLEHEIALIRSGLASGDPPPPASAKRYLHTLEKALAAAQSRLRLPS